MGESERGARQRGRSGEEVGARGGARCSVTEGQRGARRRGDASTFKREVGSPPPHVLLVKAGPVRQFVDAFLWWGSTNIDIYIYVCYNIMYLWI